MPIQFSLVVDDFGVKYVGNEHAKYLMSALKEDYTIVGITLDWDYDEKKVHLSMPGYIAAALLRFKHPTPSKRQDSPHPHTAPKYGAKTLYGLSDHS